MSKKFDDSVFEFGNNVDENATENFDYNSINGLGESDYENSDLFRNEDLSNDGLVQNEVENEPINALDETNVINPNFEPSDIYSNTENVSEANNGFNAFEPNNDESMMVNVPEVKSEELPNIEENNSDTISDETQDDNVIDIDNVQNNVENVEAVTNDESQNDNTMITDNAENFVEENTEVNNTVDEISNIENPVDNEELVSSEEPPVEIEMSDTPIEDLNKLTEYKEDKIDPTDIKSLFDRVSLNVQDASEIFKKNTEMKEILDKKFEEITKLKEEVDTNKKNQLDEINNYKEEVLSKLNEKKSEIEERLNTLKELQEKFDNEKAEFENYRKEEEQRIEQVQQEVQDAYDTRREELSHIEDILRRQKDALDEERNQLSLDKIQYESDKNELANNLLKFNELVDSFTNGVNEVSE